MIELEKQVVLRLSPPAYFTLEQLNIEYVEDAEFSAQVWGRRLRLSKRFFDYPVMKRVAVLIHEIMHKLFRHDRRAYYFQGNLLHFNIGADAKVNYLIKKMYPRLGEYLVDWRWVFSEWELEHLSAEDLARRLPEKAKQNTRLKRLLEIGGVKENSKKYGEYEFFTFMDMSPPEDIDVNWIFAMSELFGRGKGRELREFQRFVPPRIDWSGLLSGFISQRFRVDMGKINRRLGVYGEYVGLEPYKVALVDVSMSISDMEFDRFVSTVELLGFDKIVYFDNGVQDVSDRVKYQVRGKGGTRIVPAINYAIEELNNEMVLVVFSDGYWDDEKEAVRRLQKLGAYKVLITVDKVVDGFDKVVRLESYDL